jgi:hypothetical protein
MPIEFFDFGSHETYLFFQWIVENSPSIPDVLIADAFDKAEKRPRGIEFSISHTVRDRLAEILDDILTLAILQHFPRPGTVQTYPIRAVRTRGGKVKEYHIERTTAEALFNSVAIHALDRIDWKALAEALLIRAGKWVPDKKPPKAE